MDKNLQQFKKMLSGIMQESDLLTKEDFVKSFQQIVDFVLKLEASVQEKTNTIEKDTKDSLDKIVTDAKDMIMRLETGVDGKMMDLVKKALDDQQKGLNYLYDRVARLQDGKQGPKGDKGDSIVGPQGAEGIGIDGKDGSPDTAEQIVQKLESLRDDDRLDVSAIKGIEELIHDVRLLKSRPVGVGGGIVGRDIIKDVDISAQLDGVTTTFNIAGVWNIISVDLSSFPYGSLRKNVDYTWTPTSITFTSEIDAATQLATGQSCVLTVVSA